MILLIISLLFLVLSIAVGYKKLFYLDQLSIRKLLYTAIFVLLIFSLMQWFFRTGILSQNIAGAFMTVTYSCAAGSFMGSAFKLFRAKTESGNIEYVHQSFLTHILPNLVAIALILFGLQRTSLLGELPVTPIRLSSGISIMMVGLWGFTIRLVPELRQRAIIILDRKIPWDAFVSYSWFSERVISIEYESDGHIKEFRTMIPDEDHVKTEELLNKKLLKKYQNQKEREIRDEENAS